MANLTDQLTLEFNSNLKYTEFCAVVFAYLEKYLGIDDDKAFKIEIALREVINNAILHGNKQEHDRKVFVKFKWNKGYLYISVKDENPEKVDFDKIDKKLKTQDILSFNGRGILIMKNYMDKVVFNSTGSGTEIIMEKKI
jgi:serine/threonine-protein kinase RsbW